MLGRKGLLSGFITIFFVSIVVFFIIYFLVPEVSMKFFGITFRQEAYMERSLEEMLVTAGMSEDRAAGIVSAMDSDAVRDSIEKGSEYLQAGTGVFLDWVESLGEST